MVMEKGTSEMKHGDFSALAQNYAKFRPGYSENVLSAILGLVEKRPQEIDFVDVGAGTGIWTRLVARRGCRTVIAVEPNDEMRAYGTEGNGELDIQWQKGGAEDTGLVKDSCNLVSMASSFHWPEFDKTVKEFYRILRSGGWFAALWNPRLIEVNPLLVEIENTLGEIVPDMKRVSSGRSEFCKDLTERLLQCGYFKSVLYLESRHIEKMSVERYLGVWRSVNDIHVQAGPEKFEQFMAYIQDRIKDMEYIEATYLTRAWVAQTKKE